MKALTKEKLLTAWQFCDDNDKSTEFMLQFMQDFAGVDLYCVVSFIQKTSDEERIKFNKLTSKLNKNRKDEN
jgi:hypothetical protein